MKNKLVAAGTIDGDGAISGGVAVATATWGWKNNAVETSDKMVSVR